MKSFIKKITGQDSRQGGYQRQSSTGAPQSVQIVYVDESGADGLLQEGIRQSQIQATSRRMDICTRYWLTGRLEFTDELLDGFYCCFGVFPEAMEDPMRIPRLELLRQIPVIDGDTREVIIVDPNHDDKLVKLLELAQTKVANLRQEGKSELKQAQVLGYVVTRNMGDTLTEPELEERWNVLQQSIKRRHKSVVIPIGRIKSGLLRHRALMFKFLADSLKISSRIEDTCQVVVNVKRQQWHLDLMDSPGRMLLLRNSTVRDSGTSISRNLAEQSSNRSRTVSGTSKTPDGGHERVSGMGTEQSYISSVNSDEINSLFKGSQFVVPQLSPSRHGASSMSNGPHYAEGLSGDFSMSAVDDGNSPKAGDSRGQGAGWGRGSSGVGFGGQMHSRSSHQELAASQRSDGRRWDQEGEVLVRTNSDTGVGSQGRNTGNSASPRSAYEMAKKAGKARDSMYTWERGVPRVLSEESGRVQYSTGGYGHASSSQHVPGSGNGMYGAYGDRQGSSMKQYSSARQQQQQVQQQHYKQQQAHLSSYDSPLSARSHVNSDKQDAPSQQSRQQQGNPSRENSGNNIQQATPTGNTSQDLVLNYYNSASQASVVLRDTPRDSNLEATTSGESIYRDFYRDDHRMQRDDSRSQLRDYPSQSPPNESSQRVRVDSGNNFGKQRVASDTQGKVQGDLRYQVNDAQGRDSLAKGDNALGGDVSSLSDNTPYHHNGSRQQHGLQSDNTAKGEMSPFEVALSQGVVPPFLKKNRQSQQSGLGGSGSTSANEASAAAGQGSDDVGPNTRHTGRNTPVASVTDQSPYESGAPPASIYNESRTSSGFEQANSSSANASQQAPFNEQPPPCPSPFEAALPPGLSFGRKSPISGSAHHYSNSASDNHTLSNGQHQSTGPTPDPVDLQLATARKQVARGTDGEDEHVNESLDLSHLPSFDDIKIDPSLISIKNIVGRGSYGEVYRGNYEGTEVAIKYFFEDVMYSRGFLEEFKREVMILKSLRHPNVVLFMGAIVKPPRLGIVTQYLPRCSLFKLLHPSDPNAQPLSEALDLHRRLIMALDVAKGMNHLHKRSPPIVHLDLKSPNLLVDRDWTVKVCDFGLSRLKYAAYLSHKQHVGTAEWTAPEVLRNERANEKADIYSFGVILYELVTGKEPWSNLSGMQVIGAVGFAGEQLSIPDDVPPHIADLMRSCWRDVPEERPQFEDIIVQLNDILRKELVQEKEKNCPSESEQ